MYIVKLSENKSLRTEWFPDLQDGYHEVETLEEAMEIRKSWIEKYPHLVNVQIFKSEEIIIEDNLYEESLKKKEEYYRKLKYFKDLGFDSYKIINEDGSVEIYK